MLFPFLGQAIMASIPLGERAGEALPVSEERIVPTGCVHDCLGFCALRAHVRDGVVVRMSLADEGAETRSWFGRRGCARGLAYRQRVYHPDRLMYPLVRTGERGEGRFRRATWPEALDITAAAIKRIRDRYGNQALFVHSGTGNQGILRGNLLAQRLLGLMGGFLGQHGNYSNACTLYASTATYGTIETGNSHDDLLNSRYVILWSANLAHTHTGTGAPWYIWQAKQRGARVVYIDPVYTDTAVALADEWIPIYPGTDNALMDAMAYTMIDEGLLDRPFLDTYCVGFDEAHLPAGAPPGSSYESHVLGRADGVPKTPAWAEAITGVRAEVIVRLAREYATAKPAALIEGWGAQRAAFGEQPARGGAVLAAMTGNVGISGGGAAGLGACERRMRIPYLPVNNPVSAKIPIYVWPRALTHAREMRAEDGLQGAERLETNIKLILNIQGNALVNQHSHINHVTKVLRDPAMVEFILVADQFLTASARYADVVFPASTWLEREDAVAAAWSGDYALFLNKAIEPLGEAKSDYWAMAQVADRLGVGEAFSEGRDEEGWLRHQVAQAGIEDYEGFKRTGIFRRRWPRPHVAFADFRRDPVAHPLATPSGKIEIYAQLAAAVNDPAGVPAVPKYIPSWEGRTDPLRDRYPLQLLTPHPKFRTHSTFANVPWLQELSEDGLYMNPVDAAVRGIGSGDQVRVWNDRGMTLAAVRLTERVMPGVVVLPQGRWFAPRADGVDEGGCANMLTSLRPSPWAKGNTQHTSLVQVAREEGGQ